MRKLQLLQIPTTFLENKVQGRLLEKSGNFLSDKAPLRIGVDRGSKFSAGCQFIFVQSRAPECFSSRGLPSYQSPVGKMKACQESENLLQDFDTPEESKYK